jgi:hypothetical protein
MACEVAYDIDSFAGFGGSLESVVKPPWMQGVTQMRQSMTFDIHIEARVLHTSKDPE